MDEDQKLSVFMMITTIASLLICGLIGVFVRSWICSSKWDSFNTRWGLVKGCQIEVGGKWIPSESYYFKEE